MSLIEQSLLKGNFRYKQTLCVQGCKNNSRHFSSKSGSNFPKFGLRDFTVSILVKGLEMTR